MAYIGYPATMLEASYWCFPEETRADAFLENMQEPLAARAFFEKTVLIKNGIKPGRFNRGMKR